MFAVTKCVKLELESAEIAHGKPITASSTCGAFETYCYSIGKRVIPKYNFMTYNRTIYRI